VSKAICLVDDDASVRKSLTRLLESAGFRVSAFASGEDFLEYVQANSVPVVVLDIWMAQMTGLEVLARLCAMSPQTRIIIITGVEDFAVKAIAKQVGAAAFLLKPFDDAEFLAKVQYALGERGSRETKVR
jgi:two-component system, LuxR family, response regulator FixJ